jgi:hypothetical protein
MGNSFSKKNEDDHETKQVSPKLYIWGNNEMEDLNKMQNDMNENVDLLKKVDNIASRYILTMDFTTMKQLHNKEYCNQLVILTKDILNRYYSEIEVRHIRQRTEKGESLLYAHKKDVESITNKESDCEVISKFYVKIGHLFAAILMTISPKYEYIDPVSGKKIIKSLNEKEDIPDNVDINQYSNGLCHEKMNILLGNLETTTATEKQNLSQEIGIPELMNLYYDSEYDFKTGEFNGMTTKTRKKFEKDLEDFYKAFTQQKEIPSNITKFSDIKINEYYNIFNKKNKSISSILSTNQEDQDMDMNIEIEIEMDNGKKTPIYNYLIRRYARNLKLMMKNVNYHQKQLLKILNNIFVEINENENDSSEYENINYRIQPSLTIRKLNEYIENARNIIVDMYIQCEEHFLKGLQIYEAIVEKILLHTTQGQIDTLNIIIENIHGHHSDLFSSIPSMNVLSDYVKSSV